MSDADQRSYHHGDLRQALLDRAAEVIQSRGIEALTLRGLARDLKVSHGAPNRHFSCKADLLTAIATEGYSQLMRATLSAANDVGNDPWVRLNAMGQGFVHWALNNTAQFNTTMHPDLSLYESAELKQATEAFRLTINEAVAATQGIRRPLGRRPRDPQPVYHFGAHGGRYVAHPKRWTCYPCETRQAGRGLD